MRMKWKSRILLLAAVTIIALVIVIRQIGLRPYIESLPQPPTPFPTPQITPDVTLTLTPGIAALSQVLGNVLQETANAPEGTKNALVLAVTGSPTSASNSQ